MPMVVALRVVSLPATDSITTKNPNCSGVSCSPSTVPVSSRDTTSLPGQSRRCSAS
ncbi:Uncharacterised protein [Mycobacteroides abscessus subsp. abscessus]|nr:Uncharacterised protein [Mycobacteroides abscessus subsp. abscessus]